jgi:hypothetical protein
VTEFDASEGGLEPAELYATTWNVYALVARPVIVMEVEVAGTAVEFWACRPAKAVTT